MTRSLSSVDHALYINNRGSIPPTDVIDFAIEAEAAGWDGVFLSDSFHHAFSEPWSIHAAIASHTDTITLGTWLTPIPRRQPWQFAHDVATVDQLADGRVLVGAGLGTPDEYDELGFDETMRERGDRYDEALEVITSLWSGEEIHHDGTFYTLDGVTLPVTPVQSPRVPIVLGAWWPNRKPVRRAAAWDGIMPYWPGLSGFEGPQGETAEGDNVDQMDELFAYYDEQSDDPGEIILPIDPHQGSPEYIDAALDHGVTWFLTTFYDQGPEFTIDRSVIREGPPA